MLETVIVILIVALALAWTVRRLRRMWRGEVACSGCDGECHISCAQAEPGPKPSARGNASDAKEGMHGDRS
jgi:hypothetical protein